MGRKSKTDRMYFTLDTQNAILEFNKCDDVVQRELLYRNHIEPAFQKLSEILIHSFKFYYINPTVDETINNVIAHLLVKLPKYQEDKGKAFSYFTIVARNYLIIKNRNSYKKLKEKKDLDSINYMDIETTEHNNRQQAERLDFFDPFIEYLDLNLASLFPKKNDFIIADAILEIIKRRDSLDNFNKKAIYIMIKEMTNVKSQQITKVVNLFKDIYKHAYEDYLNHAQISMTRNYRNINDRF